MTDEFAILQFSNYSKPDILSGYTLDDNVRALLAFTMHYQIYDDDIDLKYIKKYLDFIKYILDKDNKMYNMVNYRNN